MQLVEQPFVYGFVQRIVVPEIFECLPQLIAAIFQFGLDGSVWKAIDDGFQRIVQEVADLINEFVKRRGQIVDVCLQDSSQRSEFRRFAAGRYVLQDRGGKGTVARGGFGRFVPARLGEGNHSRHNLCRAAKGHARDVVGESAVLCGQADQLSLATSRRSGTSPSRIGRVCL